MSSCSLPGCAAGKLKLGLLWLAVCTQLQLAVARCTLKPTVNEFFKESCENLGATSSFMCIGKDGGGCNPFCCWSSEAPTPSPPIGSPKNETMSPAEEHAAFREGLTQLLWGLTMTVAGCCCIGLLCCLGPIYCCYRGVKERLAGDDDSDSDSSEDERVEACPSYWVNTDPNKRFDDRYEQDELIDVVQQMFDTTWKDVVTRDRKGGKPIRLEVVSVQRFEDGNMWDKYVERKKKIKRKRGYMKSIPELDGDRSRGQVLTDRFVQNLTHGGELDRSLNEHYLFHGTSPAAAEHIAEDGFRINLAGSNAGTMFGKGAYFAECSSKADEYALSGAGSGPLGFRGFSQEEDEYAMLLCRVCCGQAFRALRASDKSAILPKVESKKIDSVLGDREASVGTYREFVVFKESQIYPEYRVLYRRIYNDSDTAE